MNDRIDQLRAEYRDLQSRMQDPAMHADPSELARLGKRFSRLESILSAADEREACLRSIEAAAEIRDPELLGLAEEEAAPARAPAMADHFIGLARPANRQSINRIGGLDRMPPCQTGAAFLHFGSPAF